MLCLRNRRREWKTWMHVFHTWGLLIGLVIFDTYNIEMCSTWPMCWDIAHMLSTSQKAVLIIIIAMNLFCHKERQTCWTFSVKASHKKATTWFKLQQLQQTVKAAPTVLKTASWIAAGNILFIVFSERSIKIVVGSNTTIITFEFSFSVRFLSVFQPTLK